MEHTNLDRKAAALPKVLRQEKWQEEMKKVEELEQKEKDLKQNAAKIKKQEKKKAKKLEKKKEEQKAKNEELKTLFVRNIGYETDEAKFREFMQKFGAIKYAVLCKPNRVID